MNIRELRRAISYHDDDTEIQFRKIDGNKTYRITDAIEKFTMHDNKTIVILIGNALE